MDEAEADAIATAKSSGAQESLAKKEPREKAKKNVWRPWIRAIHRDAGYVVVGLTFIYALSGIAVNHITDWGDGDPSFHTYSETHQLGPMTGTDEEIATRVRATLHITQEPREVYRRDDDEIDVTFDKRSLHVNARTGEVVTRDRSRASSCGSRTGFT